MIIPSATSFPYRFDLEENSAVRVPFAGRLPVTWAASADQVPINVGDADYSPLYPYGWGLRTDGARDRLEALVASLPAGAARDGVQESQMRKLKLGQIPFEGSLDLHGMTVEKPGKPFGPFSPKPQNSKSAACASLTARPCVWTASGR